MDLSNQHTFNEKGVERIVNTVRTVEAMSEPVNAGIAQTFPSNRSFIEVAKIYGTALASAGRYEAKLVYKENYSTDWEYVDEDLDSFWVICPTLGSKVYPVDTVVYCFYHRRSAQWVVFHAEGCPVDAE